MINHVYNELFYEGSTDKQWKIKYSNGVIGNADELFSESIQLDESLCSESDLSFGCCEASVFKFKVANIFTSLKGEWLDVSVIIDDNENNPLVIGKYKVLSDNVTADRQWRDVVAYDAIYDIINADVTDWYNSILPNNDSKVTMHQFRKSFIEHFGLKEFETSLVNDDMVIEKTISIQSESDKSDDVILKETGLSGKDVITAICEINGCFGHIGRDGLFHYIYLSQDIQGLYPADFLFPDNTPEEYDYLSQSESGSLYPQDAKGFKIDISNYITCEYEDYHVKSINKLQIRQEENDIGVIWQDEKSPGDNCYIIQGNFLVYGKSSDELSVIAKNIYEKIKNIIYRPFSADCIGNLRLEVGDPICIFTTYAPVESYILKRTLKGIQALRDTYSADGNEERLEQVNSIHSSIVQLKGKANTLSRSIEETRSTIADLGEGLQTQITQNANTIALEATSRADGDKELSGRIDVVADQVVLKVDSDGNIVEVALTSDPEKGTEFIVKADNISLSAEEAMEFLAGGTLNLTGQKIKIESDNFSVDETGKVIAKSIDITGGTINIETGINSENKIEMKYVGNDGFTADQTTMDSDGISYEKHSRLSEGDYVSRIAMESRSGGFNTQLSIKNYTGEESSLYLSQETNPDGSYIWIDSKTKEELNIRIETQGKPSVTYPETEKYENGDLALDTKTNKVYILDKRFPLNPEWNEYTTAIKIFNTVPVWTTEDYIKSNGFFGNVFGNVTGDLSGKAFMAECDQNGLNIAKNYLKDNMSFNKYSLSGDIVSMNNIGSLNPWQGLQGGYPTIGSGLYLVFGQVTFESVPESGTRACRILFDGQEQGATQLISAYLCVLQCMAVFKSETTSAIMLQCLQNSGSTLNCSGELSVLKIK